MKARGIENYLMLICAAAGIGLSILFASAAYQKFKPILIFIEAALRGSIG